VSAGPIIRTSHSYKLPSSASPAENPSTGRLVSSVSCLRSSRVLDGFGVDGRATEVDGEFFCAGFGAVDDEDGGGAVLDEMAGGELGHLACADEEDGFSLQGTEDLSGEVYGYRGDGDGA